MSGDDEAASRARLDAEWQSIVDGYGAAPAFPELAATPEPEPEPEPAYDVPAELRPDPWEDEDRFVPPPPPPVTLPRGPRGFAWFGLFGVPALMLVLLLVHLSLPSAVVLLMLAWFVGGFGYLVATMKGPKDPDSGWDDGAVL
ncbi:MAG: hypothetical protein JWQ74_2137 [Marmoricola sp.]|nr:hypothetical protein [Marmoricola sp.]